MAIGVEDIVGELMAIQPTTIRVFLNFKMACVGCPISEFHTVSEACREHGVEPKQFLAALRATVILATV